MILLLLACILPASGALFAEETTGFVPRQAVVLLTNGELLSGKVSLAGDQYFVWVPEGEIRLPTKRVQRVCDTVDDAYSYLARSSMGSIDDHLGLAAWCLRYELLGYAAKEISAAIALNADHPRIALFARRLELAQTRLKAPSAVSDASTDNLSTETDEPEEIGPVVLDLAEGGVAEFTSRLQPLLINKCAGAGCHGTSTESSFRLIRNVGNRYPTRGQTQQNLIAVLQQIDKEQPQNSPLLLKPLEPAHGGQSGLLFSDQDQAQYERLVEFANLVGDKPLPPVGDKPEEYAAQSPADPFPSEMQRPQPGASPTDAVQSAEPSMDGGTTGNGGPPVGDEEFKDLTDEAILEAFEASPVQHGAIVERYRPIDEFDAEIFNRRFFPVSPPKSAKLPPAE